MRPLLRPGTHVLRRAGGQLQVGLDPGSALVLTDNPAVRDSLRLLCESAGEDAYAEHATLDQLAANGALVEEGDLVPLLACDDLSPHATAALARDTGAAVLTAHAARRGWRTTTTTFGPPIGDELRAEFVALTRRAGLREATTRRAAPPDCAVLLGVGEPDRALTDTWTRAGTPYLVVRLVEGRAVIGPFVKPGTTACLRCLDAHCTDADPSWPLLVRQYSTASARTRADGAPEPVDPLVASLALAWAARDLASYVDGGRPSSWSATVTVHPQLSRLETRSWLRHPACGCSWA